MMQTIELFSVVAALEDVPELGIVRGQVGTVVDLYSPTIAEVEFSDDEGRTYAMGTLPSDRLVLLHHRPLGRTA